MSIDDKAIEEAAKTARYYLDPIVLQPLSELGLLLKENISFWRFKNQVNTVLKARAFLEQKGVQAKAIKVQLLPETIVPLIEAAGESSDDTLSNMFAGLLASAINPDTHDSVHPAYAKVLNQLSPIDALNLMDLYNAVSSTVINSSSPPENYNPQQPLYRQLGIQVDFSEESSEKVDPKTPISFQNIKRLGLCDEGCSALDRANQIPKICFTDFGMSFIQACLQNQPVKQNS
jgi:hypothetical protein